MSLAGRLSLAFPSTKYTIIYRLIPGFAINEIPVQQAAATRPPLARRWRQETISMASRSRKAKKQARQTKKKKGDSNCEICVVCDKEINDDTECVLA